MMRAPSSVIIVVAVLLVAPVAACGAATEPSAPPGSTVLVTAAPGSPSPSQPSTSLPPLETPVPSESASASPSHSAAPVSGEACSGTDANRDFYRSVAEAVDWDVYCAVLPPGWNVDTGQYRLAGGGRIEIAYKGPLGGRFLLREGAFCGEADGCVPDGLDLGPSPFGERSGTLIAADDGSWANVVDVGDPIAWMAVGSRIDEDQFRAFTTSLTIVDE